MIWVEIGGIIGDKGILTDIGLIGGGIAVAHQMLRGRDQGDIAGTRVMRVMRSAVGRIGIKRGIDMSDDGRGRIQDRGAGRRGMIAAGMNGIGVRLVVLCPLRERLGPTS